MDDRLVDLEVKIAFVEQHVAVLDQLVREGLDALARLQRELHEVRTELDVASVRGDPGAERPPHHLGPVDR